MIPGASPLENTRHELFCQHRADGLSQLAAYEKAGYRGGHKANASALDRKANVKDRVHYLLSEKANAVAKATAKAAAENTKRVAISKEWVLDQLIEVAEMGKAAEPVLDKDGNPVGEYKQNLAAANKALELIGKEIGMFIERKEIRTGTLDDIPFKQRQDALDTIRAELQRRNGMLQ